MLLEFKVNVELAKTLDVKILLWIGMVDALYLHDAARRVATINAREILKNGCPSFVFLLKCLATPRPAAAWMEASNPLSDFANCSLKQK